MAEQATCFNCGKDVDEDAYCNGCEHYVCDDCDQNQGLMGSHDEEDHLNDPDEEDEEDEDDLDDEDEEEDLEDE